MENPIKMDYLGVPLFLETPTCWFVWFFQSTPSRIFHQPLAGLRRHFLDTSSAGACGASSPPQKISTLQGRVFWSTKGLATGGVSGEPLAKYREVCTCFVVDISIYASIYFSFMVYIEICVYFFPVNTQGFWKKQAQVRTRRCAKETKNNWFNNIISPLSHLHKQTRMVFYSMVVSGSPKRW